jgi:high-affinity nickel permease
MGWTNRYKLWDRDFKEFLLLIAAVLFSLFISSLCSIGLIRGSISIHGGFLEHLNKVSNRNFGFLLNKVIYVCSSFYWNNNLYVER